MVLIHTLAVRNNSKGYFKTLSEGKNKVSLQASDPSWSSHNQEQIEELACKPLYEFFSIPIAK